MKHWPVSVSQITILLLYLLAAIAFAMSRLPNYAARMQPLLIAAVSFVAAGLMLHGQELYVEIYQATGLRLSIASAASLIGLQLALIGLLGALEPTLRGMTAGLLLLASVAMIPMGLQPAAAVDRVNVAVTGTHIDCIVRVRIADRRRYCCHLRIDSGPAPSGR